MATVIDAALRDQLLDRRHRLENFVEHDDAEQLRFLLEEVDAALARMDEDTFGTCEACHGTVETERLMADPLVPLCLGRQTPSHTRALEEDLQPAARIQAHLLPCPDRPHAASRAPYTHAP